MPFVLSTLSNERIERVLSNQSAVFALGESFTDWLLELYVLRERSHNIHDPEHGEIVARLGNPSEWQAELSDHQRSFFK